MTDVGLVLCTWLAKSTERPPNVMRQIVDETTIWNNSGAIDILRLYTLYNLILPTFGMSCQTTLNLQQVKTYFVRFLKPIYLNWRIYNIKPVYYVWNVFDLYGLRIYFNCVLNGKRLGAISVELGAI